MAVDLDLLNANSITNINTNFTRVQTALQDAVSRSGNLPNHMNADIDMNSNDILNVNRIDVQELFMDGMPIASIPAFEEVAAIAAEVITVAGISTEVVTVAANITSVNTVAANIGNVNTVVGITNDITTVAGISADVTTVAGISSDINVVVANIVDIQNAEENADAAAASAAAALASENAVALSSLFVGAIVMRFGPVEPGFIAWGEGGTFDRTTYPQLATWLDNNGASLGLSAPQIAAGTIPDWRDYVPRTAGGSLGPAVGAFQQDAIQEHRHPNAAGLDRVSGLVTMATTVGPAYAFVGSGSSGDVLPMGLGNGRMASETRVKSFGVRWQIKASGAAVNQGTVDIMALSSQVATLQQQALRKDVDWSAGLTVPEKVNILKNTLQVWEVAPGGVVDVTVAVPQVDWTGLDLYRMLRLKGVFIPTTADTNFRWQTGSGSFSSSTDYFSHYVLGDSNTVASAAPTGVNSGTLTAPVGTVNGLYHASINANFFEFNKARVLKFDQVSGSLSNAGPAWKTITITGGFSSTVSGRDRLRLFAAGGNIAAGSYFVLEGLRG